ncbi:MAG: glycosyltransferase [Xanthomonadales bacterium]|jgi:glycosyltransferase involved in cell wall biosynthesis|nr:glycosyltransferase [Xanthomonadales bacterium]
MHVVQALAAMSIGGSEFVATELTEALAKAGHRVTVLAAPGPLSERAKATGAETLPWPVNRKRIGTLRYIGRIRRWIAETQPDLVHVHSRLPALLVWRALAGLPDDLRPALVTTMHGHYSVSRYSGLMARGDAVIAVSEAIRRYALHNYPVEPERVHVIHGGADPETFPYGYRPDPAWVERALAEHPELRDRRWLCLPGRLSRYKGHETFINLLARLLPAYPNIQAIVVGAGRPGSRYYDELVGLAEAGGVREHLTFAGERLDIREWMAASELVFSLCSDPPEAFGRTVLEALYLGRPVVGWNHGGVAEILAECYPFGAVPPDNADALEAQTRAFLHRGAPRVEPTSAFRLSDSMAATLSLYETVLDAKHTTRSHAPGVAP